jgi:hypothetical protein
MLYRLIMTSLIDNIDNLVNLISKDNINITEHEDKYVKAINRLKPCIYQFFYFEFVFYV